MFHTWYFPGEESQQELVRPRDAALACVLMEKKKKFNDDSITKVTKWHRLTDKTIIHMNLTGMMQHETT